MIKVLVVGGGPAGLIICERLARVDCFDVTLMEQKKTVGRKFLVAGDGGLNLSNNQPLTYFLEQYNHPFITEAVQQFDALSLESWLNHLEVPTYYGSSGKLFPKEGWKPIQVLNAITDRIFSLGVHVLSNTKVVGWRNKDVDFVDASGIMQSDSFDVICFAMGGASWSTTGSDGRWTNFIEEKLKVIPFQSSNAGIEIKNGFSESYRGQFLKNVVVHVGSKSVLGEVRFTDYGLEGAPIYALNGGIRGGVKKVHIDLKPSKSEDELLQALKNWKKSRSEFLKTMKLGFGLILLKDYLTKEQFMENDVLIGYIKKFPLEVTGLRPLDEAISSVGGIDMNAISSEFEAVGYPNIFFTGEMLDWDTRTGGYLLQACFSTGYKVANTIINRFEED